MGTNLDTTRIPGPLARAEDKSSTPPILDIDELTVTFPAFRRNGHRALHELSLTIFPGEIVGLVGESGSGKTTLARSIMGLVPPPGVIEAGRVMFDGADLTKTGAETLRQLRSKAMSIIVPNPRSELNPLLPVGLQIANIAREHLGKSRREAREMALAMLRAVRIPDADRRFDAYPHEMSGGMAQRVVIAIALLCGPKFIISDDATSGLDVTVQAQVLDLMSNLVREQGAAMLFITRDIGITAQFCGRIAVMFAGEIVELADVRPFFGRPGHPYSIMLLAAFSHNPELRRRWTRGADLGAAPADGETGCAFRARCVRARELCASERPLLRPIHDGQYVRCHFPVERAA